MGVSISVHAGPLVRAKYTVATKNDAIRSCNKRGCPEAKIDTSAKFCHECGEQVRVHHIPRHGVAQQDAWDIQEHLKDQINHSHGEYDLVEGEHIWTPNVSRKGEPESLHHRGGEGFFSMSDDQIRLEKEWFEKAFAKEIQYLTEQYGSENITIDWAVFSYWS